MWNITYSIDKKSVQLTSKETFEVCLIFTIQYSGNLSNLTLQIRSELTCTLEEYENKLDQAKIELGKCLTGGSTKDYQTILESIDNALSEANIPYIEFVLDCINKYDESRYHIIYSNGMIIRSYVSLLGETEIITDTSKAVITDRTIHGGLSPKALEEMASKRRVLCMVQKSLQNAPNGD